MTSFITFEDIRKSVLPIREAELLKSASVLRPASSVFLSHSSKDVSLLPVIILILKNHGASVYVDEGDASLPPTPSADTAKILKGQIDLCRRLIVLVSTNSKESRWIPWELGVADGSKGSSKVALFPVAEHSWDQQWSTVEYLGLYRRIIWGNFAGETNSQWLVLDQHSNSATRLREWLK